jgi:anion-transporting  ArsA/GET3 family ATPase
MSGGLAAAASPIPPAGEGERPPGPEALPVRPRVFSAGVPALLDKRLLFVTGKGGVGKSTVATALGLLAARRGLRTIVAELAAQSRVSQNFDHEAEPFQEVELAPGLFTISIDPHSAMEEYLRVKAGALGHVLSSSRLFNALAMATPGLRELLGVGKVWELAQFHRRTRGADPYDLVIVDAPASGHGVAILRTPRTFADIARVGPIAHQGRIIAATIADRDFTGVIAVATPEEMPVNETLWLRDALAREQIPLDAVIVNAIYPERFAQAEIAKLDAALPATESPLARAAVKAALSEHARAQVQREQHARLRAELDGSLVDLPYVFADHIDLPQLERLAAALEDGLSR